MFLTEEQLGEGCRLDLGDGEASLALFWLFYRDNECFVLSTFDEDDLKQTKKDNT